MKSRALIVSLFLLLATGEAWACPEVNGLVDINCDEKVQIVCFGDSITRGVADSAGVGYPGRLFGFFPDAEIINLGNPGEDTYRGVTRAASSFPNGFPNADYVIVLEGVNDYFVPGANPSATRANVQTIVQIAKGVGAITLLGNLTAIRRNEQRSWVTSVNNQLNPIRQIDFFSLGEGIISFDLLHPNAAGYQVMASTVADVLLATSAQNRPADSDGDGVYDFKETQVGSNPFAVDTDGDTLSDADEIFIYRSSPLLTDTDNDGFSDPLEINVIGSDPNDPRPGAPTIQSIEILSP